MEMEFLSGSWFGRIEIVFFLINYHMWYMWKDFLIFGVEYLFIK